MPLLAAAAMAAAAAAPLSSLHALSCRGLGVPIPFPCEARPRVAPPLRRGDLAIRMGGGPRTFPGGVSKWQWKRMQARKAKQLLKARLARERQLYEMRKRAELRDAVAHLERPWDPDASASAAAAAAAPNLLSVAADDQLKALADRFHRPGGVDLWNDRDGPQVFASPDTGMASARFFPKNAIHSVQPYALLGGDAESTVADRNNGADATVRSDRVQGVRQNAAKKEMQGIGGDHEPAVEYIERGGVWEPVNNLDAGDDSNSSGGRWTNDNVNANLEGVGDVDFRPKQRAMVGRDRRKGGAARREATKSIAVGSDEFRDQRGNGLSLDPEGTSEYHLGQRWQEKNSGSRGKRPIGRRKALRTDGSSAIGRDRMVDGSSFSDSEVTRDGFEPKWKARTREGTMNGVRRWDPSNEGFRNERRKGWMDNEFDSNSDSGGDAKLMPKWKARNRLNQSESIEGTMNGVERWDLPNEGSHNERRKGWMDDEFDSNSGSRRDEKSMPTWKARNRLNRRENGRDRPELKYNADTNNGERTGRYSRGNNGDVRRDHFVNRFASDLEEPKWKPRRKSGARMNNGHRKDINDMNGGFRRGSNGGDINGRFRRGSNRDDMNGRFRSSNEDNVNGGFRRGSNRDDMNGGFRSSNGDDMSGGFRRGSNRDNMAGRFRRGSNGASRLLDAMDNNRGVGSEDGNYMMSRNERQLRGDAYSLRPTSELHNSGRDRESDEL
uniref:Uncharacterized protein n=1 Tax=Leersia perrieri TaxID=77586 RepID=A0A0D9VH88_9ORYZ